MAFDVSFVYRIVDRYSDKVDKMERKTSRFRSVVSRATRAAGRGFLGFRDAVGRAGEKLKGMADQANAVAAAITAFAVALPVNKAMAFEEAIGDIDKKFEFGSLTERAAFIQDIKTMGPELGFTATQMARLAFEAGKLNIPKDEVSEFVRLSAKAAVALDGLSIDESGQIIAKIRGQFELANDGVESMLDAVNKLADNTRTDGGTMLNILERLAGQFKTLQVPPEVAAGLAAVAGQLARSPELGAQGMKMFLRELDQAKLAAAPLETIMAKLTELRGMDIAARVASIEDQFGKEASVFIQNLTSSSKTLSDTLAVVADKASFAGSATDEFSRKTRQSAFRWQQVKARVDLLIITLGEKLLPTFNNLLDKAEPLLNKMTNFANQNPGIVKLAAAIALVGAALIPVAAILGTILIAVAAIKLPFIAAAVAVGFVVAGIVILWNKIKGMGAWIKENLLPDFDWLAEKAQILANLGNKAANFFGFGDDAPTISEAPSGTTREDFVAQQASAQQVQLNGQIGLDVRGPARVREAAINSTAPGRLGLNVAGAQ